MEEDFLNRLEVIKAADALVLAVYRYTKDFPKEELFGIVSQMRRAAISIPANIAEGYSRNNKKEKVQFYYISRGSLTELRYYIHLAMQLKYITLNQYQELSGKADKTARLLTGFISFTNRQSPVAVLANPARA